MDNKNDSKTARELNQVFDFEDKMLVGGKTIEEKLARLIDIQKDLDLRKALFAEYDLIVMSLAQMGFVKEFVGDLVLELKDNFADKNTGFTTAAIKRYEVEIITKELNAKREAKKAKG